VLLETHGSRRGREELDDGDPVVLLDNAVEAVSLETQTAGKENGQANWKVEQGRGGEEEGWEGTLNK